MATHSGPHNNVVICWGTQYAVDVLISIQFLLKTECSIPLSTETKMKIGLFCVFTDRVDDWRLEKYVPEAVQDAERDECLPCCDAAHSHHYDHLQSRQLLAGRTHTRCRPQLRSLSTQFTL